MLGALRTSRRLARSFMTMQMMLHRVGCTHERYVRAKLRCIDGECILICIQ